jgi:hypothetical protein
MTSVFFGAILFLVGIFVVMGLVMVNSRADDATSSTSITNTDPVITSINVSSSSYGADGSTFTLTSADTTNIYVHGVVSDDNGCADVEDATDIQVALYRSGVTNGADCSDDNNDCYTEVHSGSGGTCVFGGGANTCDGGADLDVDFQCTFPVEYYADPTDAGSTYAAQSWDTQVIIGDGQAGSVTGSSTGYEIATLLGLEYGTTISYGALSSGTDYVAENSGSLDLRINNIGNVAADTQVSGTAMTCSTLGSIPLANQQYSTTNVSDAHANHAGILSGTPTALELDIAQRTNDGVAFADGDDADDVFWSVDIPSAVSGTCTGTVTFTTIAD